MLQWFHKQNKLATSYHRTQEVKQFWRRKTKNVQCYRIHFPYRWEIKAYTYIMKAVDCWKLVSGLTINFLQIFNYHFVIFTTLLSVPGVWYHESKIKQNKNVNSHSSNFVCNWAHEMQKLELQPEFQLFILCCLCNFTFSIQLQWSLLHMHIQFSDKTRYLPKQYVRHKHSCHCLSFCLIAEAYPKLPAHAHTLFWLNIKFFNLTPCNVYLLYSEHIISSHFF